MFLKKLALKSALKKPIPSSIPLSGQDRLNARNYFEVRLNAKGNDFGFLADQMFPKGMTGIWFPEKTGSGSQASLPFAHTTGLGFYIRHYFRRCEIELHSPLAYWFGQLTLKCYRVWAMDRVGQFFFNRKPLTRSGRLQLLKEIMERSLSEPNYRVDQFSYFAEKFGARTIDHPDSAQERKYLRYILDSLVESGDLKMVSQQYEMTACAFLTISIAEEENRRHRDGVRIQIILAVLTGCLVIVGFVQALPD